MDEKERAELKADLKEVLRPQLLADVDEAEHLLNALGVLALRTNVIRTLRANVVDRLGRLWAKDRASFPISTEEFRVRLEVFNELMDEMATRAVN